MPELPVWKGGAQCGGGGGPRLLLRGEALRQVYCTVYSVRHGRNRAESILDGSDLELLGKLDASQRHLEFRV